MFSFAFFRNTCMLYGISEKYSHSISFCIIPKFTHILAIHIVPPSLHMRVYVNVYCFYDKKVSSIPMPNGNLLRSKASNVVRWLDGNGSHKYTICLYYYLYFICTQLYILFYIPYMDHNIMCILFVIFRGESLFVSCVTYTYMSGEY